MTKPEWGDKRTCPKCGTRFYDLGNSDPVSCIDCGAQWVPEPILKTKQPIMRDEPEEAEKEEASEDSDEKTADDLDIPADLDVDVEDDDDSDDNDDVLVDVSLDDEDSDVNDIIDVSLVKGDE